VPPSSNRHFIKTAGLVLAVAALLAVLWMPAAPGLPLAGQVMLAVLAFAVIVWMTEALDYAVSAVCNIYPRFRARAWAWTHLTMSGALMAPVCLATSRPP
jgi:hypothetical protein